MATEMAEVSNRVNFGSKPTCSEKSRKRADPMILVNVLKKKVQNSVSGKYVTDLHLFMVCLHHVQYM